MVLFYCCIQFCISFFSTGRFNSRHVFFVLFDVEVQQTVSDSFLLLSIVLCQFLINWSIQLETFSLFSCTFNFNKPFLVLFYCCLQFRVSFFSTGQLETRFSLFSCTFNFNKHFLVLPHRIVFQILTSYVMNTDYFSSINPCYLYFLLTIRGINSNFRL